MRHKMVCEKNFLYENSIKMKDIIEMLDDWQQRFLPVSNMPVDIVLSGRGIANDNDVASGSNYVLLEYNVPESISKKTCAFNSIQFKIYYLLYSYKYLIESIGILNECDILHMDINNESIYWNNNIECDLMFYSNHILISNFSKSLYEPNVKAIFNLLKDDETIESIMYGEHVAPELKLLCYVKLNSVHILTEEMVMEFVAKYLDNGLLDNNESCKYLIDTYCDIENISEEIFKHHKTWDIYALNHLFFAKAVEIMKIVRVKNEPLSSLIHILKLNISLDPTKRLNAGCILAEI